MRKKKKKQPAPKAAQFTFSSSTEILVIDQSKLVKDAERRLKLKRNLLEKKTEALKTFTEIDRPGYAIWYQAEFGDLLKDLSDVSSEVEDYNIGHLCLSLLTSLNDLTPEQAWEKIYHPDSTPETRRTLLRELHLRQQEKNLKNKNNRKREFEDLKDAFEFDSWNDDEKEGFESFWDFFNNFGDSSRQHNDSSKRAFSPYETSRGSAHNDSFLKNIYRKVVRKLHPDLNPDQTAEDKNLFLELQQAYEWGDHIRVERIAALVLSNKKDRHYQPSVWDLMQSKKELERKINTFNKELRDAKSSEAWNFHAWSKDKKHVARHKKVVSENLKVQLLELRSELFFVKETHKEFKASFQSKKSKKKRSNNFW